MKIILKISLLVIVCCLLVTSCDEDYKIEEDNLKEGMMSNTGDNDMISLSDAKEMQTVVLYHKSYPESLSLDEANALWNKEITNLMVPSLKGASTEWFHWVRTRTGPQTNNGTDARVDVWIHYKTDIGTYVKRAQLNNSGNDREKGQWDYYLLRSTIPDKSIRWIELKRSTLGLQGTDGWFVTRFYVYMIPSKQNIPSSGSSSIISQPNVWLDNSTSSGWDYYNTGNIGRGRLTF